MIRFRTAAVAGLAVAAMIMLASEHGREGTDDTAKGAIQALRPSYQQWAKPVWTASSPRAESILFAIQAGIGVAVLGWILIRARKGKRSRGGA